MNTRGICGLCKCLPDPVYISAWGSFEFSLVLTQLPSALFLIVIGPLSEELGWRGYAQTWLQARWNPLVTGVVVGTVWALWHLPLFLWPGTSQHELKIPFLGFFCGMTSLSVLFAWLHNHTNGMIWTAVFFSLDIYLCRASGRQRSYAGWAIQLAGIRTVYPRRFVHLSRVDSRNEVQST